MYRVLIVDDEPDAGIILQGFMVNVGIEADVVRNSQEALNLLAMQDYAAVVIDLAMPGIDGWQLLRQIRSIPRLAMLPLVAVTAYYNSVVRQEVQQAGFDAFFQKPVSDITFGQEMISLIESHHSIL